MTNQQIVDKVYRTYKVKCMIIKMIGQSTLDNSCDDLEQHIYTILLLMDNEKLNYLYLTKGLKKWISQIIRNQRNYYKSNYNVYGKVLNVREPFDDEIYNKQHNYMLDWFDYELDKYDWNSYMTKEEIDIAGDYEMLKFYLSSHYSMAKIAKLFNVSTMKISLMISNAKKNIKISYDNGSYDDYIRNNLGEFMGDTP